MKHAQIFWFEIPVKDLDRAARFYSSLLSVMVDKQNLLDKPYGIFRKEDTGIGGALVKKEHVEPGKGISLFFYVSVLSDSLDVATRYGGRIVTPKTLIKQTDASGNRTIAQNMIDNKVGYFAELLDSEGNSISLYSNC